MTGDSNICGSSIYGDRIVSIDVRFPHTAETLELKLWDNNDEDPTNVVVHHKLGIMGNS